MLYPTINELTKGKFNRYELALATAKCARLITDEYVKQKERADRELAENKDSNGSRISDKPLTSYVNKDYRDIKAVKNAITQLSSGKCVIVRKTQEQMEAEAEEREREEVARRAALEMEERKVVKFDDDDDDDVKENREA